MAPNKKYLSLEEAAAVLGLKADELIRLREKGEVRGFADRGTWKFKADDVAEFRRRRQPDSDPDLAIMDDEDDEDPGRQATVIRRGSETKSDSDVRLSRSADEKKKQLTGSSGELSIADLQKSDSDVRLVGHANPPKKDSDSDVKLIKPKSGFKSESDSDVKIVDAPAPDSDSDVKLLESNKSLRDSDSDVRLAHSDSDVRLAPMISSDSDVKLVGRKSSGTKTDSDSDVTLLPPGKKGTSAKSSSSKSSDSGPLLSSSKDIDFDLGSSGKGDSILLDGDDSSDMLSGDSGIQLAGDSGIQLAGDSGIRLSGPSGIRLGGDSSFRLQDDSGLQLKQPADSGISLEGQDSGVRLADSGINLGDDSGINLLAPSSKKLKGSEKKGGSSKKLKGSPSSAKDRSPPPLHSNLDDSDLGTSPMLSAMDSGAGSAADLDLFDSGDTSELQSLGDSGQNVVMFEDEDDDGPPAAKRPKHKTVEESIFEMDESQELDELEVSDDDLSGELDDLAFDDGDGDLDDSFTTGSSQLGIGARQKVAVAQEVEYSMGVFFLLTASVSILIVGALMSADLLSVVWDQGRDSKVSDGLAGMLAGFWK